MKLPGESIPGGRQTGSFGEIKEGELLCKVGPRKVESLSSVQVVQSSLRDGRWCEAQPLPPLLTRHPFYGMLREDFEGKNSKL